MGLSDRLYADLQQAVRGRDAIRVSTIRLARAAVHNAEIERGRALSENEIIEILGREVKRRREAIEAYAKGNREDLVQKETLELAILTEYLPAALSDEELRDVITHAIREAKAKDQRDIGRVMAAVMPKVKGRAEGKTVDRLVRSLLPRAE